MARAKWGVSVVQSCLPMGLLKPDRGGDGGRGNQEDKGKDYGKDKEGLDT